MSQESASIKLQRRVLSDTFVLYMKTYAVHWNYTGSNFFSVHKLTEQQYQELAEAVDELAERMRALGQEAPLSLSDILDSADLKEIKSHGKSPSAILEELALGNEQLSKLAKKAADACDEDDDDFGNDRMIARIGAHDKAAWMLKSVLKHA